MNKKTNSGIESESSNHRYEIDDYDYDHKKWKKTRKILIPLLSVLSISMFTIGCYIPVNEPGDLGSILSSLKPILFLTSMGTLMICCVVIMADGEYYGQGM